MKHLTRAGERLAYEDVGEGEQALVFVHGMVCDHRYFEPQVDHFSRTHRVVAVDLRGHGESEGSAERSHPDDYADDIACLITELGLVKPVVIGHSMGGLVALRLAHLRPDVVGAIVALDSAWLVPEAVSVSGAAVLEKLRGPNCREVFRQIVENGFFLPTDDPERKAWITNDMCSASPDLIAAQWEHAGQNTDTETPLASLAVPALYIAAAFPFGDVERIRQAPGVTVGQTIGTGHFMQLEAPDQVNAMIERYLRITPIGA